jgi:hypothetical protein
MQYVEKKFMEKIITICSSKIMFITICYQKKSPYGLVVQWLRTWLLNVEVRSSSPHICNLGYLSYLGDLIR